MFNIELAITDYPYGSYIYGFMLDNGLRKIHNILIAHQMFHFLKTRKWNRSGRSRTECALKMDMQKVYDRVEWDFLVKVLETSYIKFTQLISG